MKKIVLSVVGFFILSGVDSLTAQSQVECQDSLNCQSSWIDISDAQQADIFTFADEYKDFIHNARTELSFVTEAILFAQSNGFQQLSAQSSLSPGGRFYEVNRDRTITLLVIGEQSMAGGFHVIGSHIDSPRLELKGRPLFQANEFALFQTNYHGGIKYHQWTNLPLALMGRVDRKDGPVINNSVGLDPDDPVFMLLRSNSSPWN